MINPGAVMKLMNLKNQFTQRHPKFAAFFQTIVSQGVEEGSIIEITVTRPDKTPVTGNMRVEQADLELIRELQSLSKS